MLYKRGWGIGAWGMLYQSCKLIAKRLFGQYVIIGRLDWIMDIVLRDVTHLEIPTNLQIDPSPRCRGSGLWVV